jgi:hypothetical protein
MTTVTLILRSSAQSTYIGGRWADGEGAAVEDINPATASLDRRVPSVDD